MARYVYPAVFTKEADGLYDVNFPDLEGCYTSGNNLADAMYMAEDVLASVLYDYERNGEKPPAASEETALSVPAGSFANYIACDTLWYQKHNNNKAVKKTLTIPEWLNEQATAAGVNFSQTLQEALIAKLEA